MEGDGGSAPKIQKLSDPNDEPSTNGTHTTLENDKDKKVEKALKAVNSCQTDLDGLNEKAGEEILQVEKKYNKLRIPHYESRNEFIKDIPCFWKTIFMNHPQIREVLTKEDKDCLEYLEKVHIEEYEDFKSGYVLNFHFSSNPYFANEKLTKEFKLDDSGLDEPISTSTKIEWKDGMDLIKKNEKNKKDKKESYLPNSFFSWFIDNDEPSMDDVAEVLKDDIWPNPLLYYKKEKECEISDSEDYDSDDDLHDESVVIVDDDDDDDEEPYGVDDSDDDDDNLDDADEIEVSSDDDDTKDAKDGGT